MYIRRKVFSLLQNEYGEERYFSTTEFDMSYDGEEIRYFAKKDDDEEEEEPKKRGTGKKIAKGVGIGTAAGLAGTGIYQVARRIGKKKSDKTSASMTDINTDAINLLRRGAGMEDVGGYKQNKIDKFGHEVEMGIKRGVDKVKNSIKNRKKK